MVEGRREATGHTERGGADGEADRQTEQERESECVATQWWRRTGSGGTGANDRIAEDKQRQQQVQRQRCRGQFTVVGAAATVGHTAALHQLLPFPTWNTHRVYEPRHDWLDWTGEGDDGAPVRVNSLPTVREAAEIARLRFGWLALSSGSGWRCFES